MDIISPSSSITPPAPPLFSTSSPPPSPPAPPPETSNDPPPSPPATTTTPPVSEISPPEKSHEKKPKKSHPSKKKPNSEPPTVSPPSPDDMSPSPPATSPSSPITLSPPASLTTLSVSGKKTPNSSRFSPIESSNIRADNANGANTRTATGIGILVGFLALTLVLLAVWFKRKRNKSGPGLYANYVLPSLASSQKSDSSFLRPKVSAYLSETPSRTNSTYSRDPDSVGNSRSSFTYKEIMEATNGFSKQNILGEGGFGCVYKGELIDEREVAVKQLKSGGGQGEREFRAEVEIISRVHHRHLVSLVGYCITNNQRLLVLDFVPNGTLHHHLHSKSRPVLGWATRVRIAAGAARGLAYLHEDCHPRIIHRDIKSSNILLDINFEAQVADFGLAKLTTDTNTHVSTRVMGTFGYLAPEYAASGKLTEKSDVFSFGVVLLELITGRVPVDSSQPYGYGSLVEWARPLLTEALEKEIFDELIDSRLGNNYVMTEMFRMVEAAAACIRHSALKRPKMSQVARALDSLDENSGLSNGANIGESTIFNSRKQSA